MSSKVVSPRIDDAAFVRLLEEQRRGVLDFLRRLAPADAEDVLQETYAKVWRLRESFDPAGNGFAWLLRAAFRTLLDHRRIASGHSHNRCEARWRGAGRIGAGLPRCMSTPSTPSKRAP